MLIAGEQMKPDVQPEHVWRLLVISDKQAFAEALVDRLNRAPRLEVAACVRPGSAADAARRWQPDLNLIACDHTIGITAVRALSHAAPLARSLAVGVRADLRHVLAWAQAGASGCLTEDASMSEIVSACRRAAKGETVCTDSVGQRSFEAYRQRLTSEGIHRRSPFVNAR